MVGPQLRTGGASAPCGRRYNRPVTTPNDESNLPEQLQVRRDKRARLLAAGTDPYAITVARTHSAAEVHAQWAHLEAGDETNDVVGVGGRVVFIRNTGKLCFATLREHPAYQGWIAAHGR